jgi:hypothetical protein
MREKQGREHVCGVEKGQKRGDLKEWRIRGNRESEAFRLLGDIRKEVFPEK